MKNNNKIPISVVISAFNEEKKIADCLKSVSWTDEIIVIDNSSTDLTSEIAKKHNAKVVNKNNNIMLNVNKNYGFTHARNQWILSLDADERVTPELKDEIISHFLTFNSQAVNGYWIPRKNIIFGKWIQNSIWWPDYQLRFFRKGKGKFAEKDVHEMLDIIGETQKLENPILHQNYESVSQFIYKMDKIYTENAAKNIIDSGRELLWYDALKMPAADFLKTFFLQKGYKDGLHGLILSLLQAFYAEITFMKVWEKNGFREHNNENFLTEVIKQVYEISYEFRFWILTVMIENTQNTRLKLYYRVLRKNIDRKIKRK